MIPRSATPSPNSVLLDPDFLYNGRCSRKHEGAPPALSMWKDSFHEDDVNEQDEDSSSCDQPTSAAAGAEEEAIPPRAATDASVHQCCAPKQEPPPSPAATRPTPQSPRSVMEGSGTETAKNHDASDPQVWKNTTTHGSSCTKTKTVPLPKRVSWGVVQVRRHAIIPGDHPDAGGGPPLSLEWTALSERQVPLDQFEWERQPHRAHSSHAHHELILSADFRYELLRRNGARDVDILHSLWQSVRTHGERAQTVRELKFGVWHEFTENLQRLLQFPPPPVLQTKY